MARDHCLLASVLLCAVAVAPAQIDIIWSNVSDSDPAEYHDGIVMYSSLANRQIPLAHLINSDATATLGTGSVVDRPYHLNVGGVDYLYFFDNNVDTLFRAADGNLNGVLDPTEFEPLWDIRSTGNISPDMMSYYNGKWVLSNDLDALGSSTRGLWVLEDLNGDGDYYDTNEGYQILNGGTGGGTMIVGGATMSSDDIDAAAWLANGDIIFYEDDDRIWYRLDATTLQVTTWLGYQTGTGNASAQPQNPDIGILLPGISLDLDKVTVDYSTVPETVYLMIDFSASQRYIFRAQDLNGDGDINDTLELGLFYDGAMGAVPVYLNDQFQFHNGSLYVMSERNVLSSGVRGNEVVQLTDLDGDGNAMGLNEQTLIYSVPDGGDDPQVLAMTVVPAGTWGFPSCVGAHIETNGILAAGGVVDFTFRNVPSAGIGGTGMVGVSLAGDGPTTIGPCIVGLTFDALTQFILMSFLPQMSTPPIAAGAQTGFNTGTTIGFNLGPGQVTPGQVFYYAGVVVDPLGGIIGTQSRAVVVQ